MKTAQVPCINPDCSATTALVLDGTAARTQADVEAIIADKCPTCWKCGEPTMGQAPAGDVAWGLQFPLTEWVSFGFNPIDERGRA